VKRAVYARLLLIAVIAVFVCTTISAVFFAVHAQNQTKQWLTTLTLSIADSYKMTPDAKALSHICGGNRVTIIAPDGTVLGDSKIAPTKMDNHLSREEVQNAVPEQVTIAVRKSRTLGEKYMYAAMKTSDGNILRTAYSYKGLIGNFVMQTPAILLALLVAMVLSIFLAGRFSTAAKLLEQQKQDFFSNASHELKTPITSIAGFSEMLSNNIIEDEEERKEVLRRIETEAKRMTELITDILTISRLESHNAPQKPTAFDLGEVVREAIDSVCSIDPSVRIHTNAGWTLVSADRRQMFELCANLLENAIKYNKPGGSVAVILRTEYRQVVLAVEDTGIGIPDELQPRVFERFFRVDAGRDKKTGGTGLGLSIVKHIVQAYDGEISLASTPGMGSKIEVRLPITG
jgi:two-component system phosphate regulon sensor histidine kinase PhoR